MEVPNRTSSEEELQSALALVWREWSKTKDPELLTEEGLQELLAEKCQDPLLAVWIAANINVLDEYGERQDQAALIGGFLIYFASWRKDIATRWSSRVANYVASKFTVRDVKTRASGPVLPFATIGESIRLAEVDIYEKPTASTKIELPKVWAEAKKEILANSDFTREAVTAVTATNTKSEIEAAKKVQARGPVLIGIWRTEVGACKKCQALEGTRPSVWKKEAPNGPGLHRSCRCWIEWVRLEDTGARWIENKDTPA